MDNFKESTKTNNQNQTPTEYVLFNHKFKDCETYNFYGVVTNVNRVITYQGHPHIQLEIIDRTMNKIVCDLKGKLGEVYPSIEEDDIIRVHKAEVKNGQICLLATSLVPSNVVVFKCDVAGLLQAKSTAETIELTDEDKENASSLYLWFMNNRDEARSKPRFQPENAVYGNNSKNPAQIARSESVMNKGKFDSLDVGLYRDVPCVVCAVRRMHRQDVVIISVWDGTKPTMKIKMSSSTETVCCDYNLLNSLREKILEVRIYDDHVPVAEQLLPGSFVVLKNLHMYVPKHLQPDGPAELSLHSGSSIKRRILLLDESSIEAKSLKSALENELERVSSVEKSFPSGTRGTFSSLDIGLYRDVLCLVVGIGVISAPDVVILFVWDNTRPSKEIKTENCLEVLSCDEKLLSSLEDKVLHVSVYDTHIPVAKQLKPRSLVILKNLHMYVPKQYLPDGPAELCLHSGTSNNRGIYLLDESLDEGKLLKDILSSKLEKANNLRKDLPSTETAMKCVEINVYTQQHPKDCTSVSPHADSRDSSRESDYSKEAKELEDERIIMESYGLKIEMCPYSYILSEGIYKPVSQVCTGTLITKKWPPTYLSRALTLQVPYVHRFIASVEDLKPQTVNTACDLVWVICSKCPFKKPFIEVKEHFSRKSKCVHCAMCNKPTFYIFLMEFKLQDCHGIMHAVLKGENAVTFFGGIHPKEVLNPENPKSNLVYNIIMNLCPRKAPNGFMSVLPSKLGEFCVESYSDLTSVGVMYEIKKTQFLTEYLPKSQQQC